YVEPKTLEGLYGKVIRGGNALKREGAVDYPGLKTGAYNPKDNPNEYSIADLPINDQSYGYSNLRSHSRAMMGEGTRGFESFIHHNPEFKTNFRPDEINPSRGNAYNITPKGILKTTYQGKPEQPGDKFIVKLNKNK
ncbi:MAG: hypothetical protein HUJ52_03200, partial [Malacoplasma sp.]|nr:hypothetical protein [Malacoplasma sp.]